jgi:MFS superfamily sulfate permease-like transporter
VAGLAPTPVLAGFGLAYCATALIYRLPVPVQPMKAIVAVLLVSEVSPATLAASGVMVGAVLLVLGATGWIDALGRLVPQSVLAGLQLGLGLALSLVALRLISEAPVLGVAAGVALVGLLMFPRLPSALIVVAAALLLGLLIGGAGPAPVPEEAAAGWPDLGRGLAELALPQLSLTLTNAVILTALVAGDLYGEAARRVTPRRLAVSTGLINLGLAPLGALPMCHGAGGLAAHHRFGARTGGAPLMLGLALLVLALLPGGAALRVLGAIPVPVLGAMLLVAAAQLAWSRRLVDCVPSCRPVIAVTAVAVLVAGPFAALVAGTAAEALRSAIVRRLRSGA